MATRILTGSIYDISENARPDFALQVVVSPTAITPTGIIPESTEPIATDDDGNFNIEVVTGIQLEVWLYDAFRRIGTTTNFGNGNIIKRGMVVPHGVSPITVQAVLALNTEPDAPTDLAALANNHIGRKDNPHETILAQLDTIVTGTELDAMAGKLALVADGATANAADADLRDRTTHTGEQAIATITGLGAQLDGLNADRHTHANKTILDGIAAPNLAPNGGLVGQVLTVGASGREWDTPTVTGAEILEPDFSFAVVDEDGRRTWIEADAAGGLTDHAADKISEHISGAVEQDTSVTGLAFAVVDEDGRRTEIEVGADGRFTERVIASLAGRIGVPDDLVSGPNITAVGDSLTVGAGGNGTSWPSVLATLSGRQVTNNSVGGDGSERIAARQGGFPYLVMPDGGTIPASGGVAVTITFSNAHSGPGEPFGNATSLAGVLAGVPGTLTKTGTNAFSFTRSAAGEVVPFPAAPQPFYTTTALATRGDIFVYWSGNNYPESMGVENVLADIEAMILWQQAADKRFVVLGLINNDVSGPGSARYTAVMDANERLHQRYGRRFLDIRTYLREYALADAGITPTPADDAAYSFGTIPASLRVDTIHLNATGYELVAQQVYERLQELEWI